MVRIGSYAALLAMACALASTATAQNITPRPIPIFAWSMDELGKDRPWKASPYPNITGFFWLTQGGLKNVAQAVQCTSQQPEGRRVIFDWDVYRLLYSDPADKLTTAKGEQFTGPWWDHGLAAAEQAYDDFFRAYRDAGGKLDYFIIDTEHSPASDVNTPERWAAVAQDRRCPDLLAAMHLTSVDQITAAKPFSFTWWRYSDYLSCQRLNRLYEVIKRYFPQVKASDYGMDYHTAAQYMAWGPTTDPGDIPGRTGCHVGTHQSPSLYGVLTYLGGVVVEGKPYGLSPFRSAMYATNLMRDAIVTNPAVPVMPWVSWRGYVSDWEAQPKEKQPPHSSIGNTDYFQEVFFHAALCNPEAILTWNPIRWRADQAPTELCQPSDMVLLNDLAEQVNELVGFSDRRTLVQAMTPVHQPFLLTGCVANGRSVWRLTPDPDQGPTALEQIKIKDQPLTFKLADKTLTLPGAKVLTPAKPLSAAGYWIVGPQELKPTVAP